MDAQSNLTTSLVPSFEGATIYEALTGRTDTLPTVAITDNFHLVPASLTLAMIDVELSTAIARESVLKDVLEKTQVSDHYDYILLDLPPVTAVADALVASKLVSGMIVVVRQDYVGRAALSETMRQLKYANAKVLGFVFNSVDDSTLPYNKKYYRKGYYKGKYGYNYGYQYGYGHQQVEKAQEKVGQK